MTMEQLLVLVENMIDARLYAYEFGGTHWNDMDWNEAEYHEQLVQNEVGFAVCQAIKAAL